MDTPTSIIQNIIDNNHLESWSVVICYLAYWIGLMFFLVGVVAIAQANGRMGMQRTTSGGAILSIVTGILMLSFQAVIKSATYTLFASEGASDYSFNSVGALDITNTFQSASSGPEAIYLEFAVYVIQIVGLLAIIRAFFLFRKANESSQNAIGAAWHFVGGIMALNFTLLMKVVGETGGPEVQSVLSRMFG